MDPIVTRSTFTKLYREAEARADAAPNGVSFSIDDRSTLNEQRIRLGMNTTEAAFQVALRVQGGAVVVADLSKAASRFNLWDRQAKARTYRRNLVSTEQATPVEPVPNKEAATVRRINTREDVPKSLNTAVPQFLEVGLGLPEALEEITAAYRRAQSQVADKQRESLGQFPKSFQRDVLTELLNNLKD